MRRRGGITAAIAAVVVLGLVLVVAATRGSEEDAARRPDLDPGETTRIVDGHFVAMAVEGDGTLWLVRATGAVHRADPDGGLVRVPGVDAPATDLYAAAALDSHGELYVVTDQSPNLWRRRGGNLEITGLPDEVGLTGLAVAPDGTVYVADGLTGTVYAVDGDGRATAVDGTPASGCLSDRYLTSIGLAVESDGSLVVGDPNAGCPSPYTPGAGTAVAPPDCPTDNLAAATPGPIAVDGDDQLVAAGGHCDLVWGLSGLRAEYATLLGQYDLEGSVAAIGIDARDRLYVLDDAGVLERRPQHDPSRSVSGISRHSEISR